MSTDPAAPAVGREPRWHRRKEARPAEILAAALEMFVEHGYAATKLEDVARRAGVTKGTMYLYFDSKEALFKEVVRTSLVSSIERGEQMVEAHAGSARELLEALLRLWLEALRESRSLGIPKLMVAEATNFPELSRFYYEEIVRRGHRLIGRVIQRGIDHGEFRPVNVPYAVRLAVAPILLTAIMQHSLYACTGEKVDIHALMDLHIELFLRGLARERSAGAPDA